jgi:hypothetical protein
MHQWNLLQIQHFKCLLGNFRFSKKERVTNFPGETLGKKPHRFLGPKPRQTESEFLEMGSGNCGCKKFLGIYKN